MTIVTNPHQPAKQSIPLRIIFLFVMIFSGHWASASSGSSGLQMHEQSDQGSPSAGSPSSGTSSNLSSAEQSGQQRGELVLVAGATGGTGHEVIRELLASGYRVRAFVRDEAEARVSLGDEVEYAVGDVREPTTIYAALKGVDALVSVIGAGGSRGDPDNTPEFVDYGGVLNMANAASRLRRFVLVSAAGVTHEDHVLNKMFNNVLKWKFKGEEALRASGVPYTIIRPAGLDDSPGGQKKIIFVQGDDETGIISRADLARICVAALGSASATNKTFEVIHGKSLPDDVADDNFDSAFAALLTDSEATSVVSDETTDEKLQ